MAPYLVPKPVPITALANVRDPNRLRAARVFAEPSVFCAVFEFDIFEERVLANALVQRFHCRFVRLCIQVEVQPTISMIHRNVQPHVSIKSGRGCLLLARRGY